MLHVVIGLLPGTCEQIGPKASNRGRFSEHIQRLDEIILKYVMYYANRYFVVLRFVTHIQEFNIFFFFHLSNDSQIKIK